MKKPNYQPLNAIMC